ncbi:TetR/AcrR family transcriptional regulator [Rhodococcus artemisiae]|uniref:TetR/AcrR family transcriptional regulator n=1 Tax=Rhodococcus artemisiae TaxID=714159 RepID=A0ABU7L6Q7_9NOCA|nr:TetR/AcrR family transcriptional regulator [Rhodococcus artemisiae]MEE2057231.1 TetR/AcrR family transcriptional regulator [Rhodococcus artemisiae]
MSEDQQRPTGRPRDPDISERLIRAALEEYAQTGWASFTMQGVARRAGVGKSALYRRWATKEQLLIDSVESVAVPLATTSDSGSLREDLTDAAARLLLHFLDPVGWATLRISIDATSSLTMIDPFQKRINQAVRYGLTAIFTRATERGEIAPDVPVLPLVQSLVGSTLMHVLSLHPDERDDARRNAAAHVEPLVDVIIRSAAHYPGSRPGAHSACAETHS